MKHRYLGLLLAGILAAHPAYAPASPVAAAAPTPGAAAEGGMDEAAKTEAAKAEAAKAEAAGGEAGTPAPAGGTAEAAEVHAAPDPADLIGPPEGTPLSGAELAQRTEEVAGTIRCPVCQGVSVADSPSEMALNMKRQTEELLARGYEAEQIIHYFEQSYGEFIRLEPKREGLKSLVWVAPGLVLLAGLAVIASFVRRHREPAEEAAVGDLPARDRLPDDPALVPWVKRVREQVYGWPGGEPPKGAA